MCDWVEDDWVCDWGESGEAAGDRCDADRHNHGDRKREQYIYPTRLYRDGECIAVPENEGFGIEHPGNRFDADGVFVPGGTRDLSGKHPGQVERARALFMSEHAENPWYVELTKALAPVNRNLKSCAETGTIQHEECQDDVF